MSSEPHDDAVVHPVERSESPVEILVDHWGRPPQAHLPCLPSPVVDEEAREGGVSGSPGDHARRWEADNPLRAGGNG